MTSISYERAARLVEAALAKGAALELKPLTVAVLDPGGHLVALARQDSSSNLRPQIAVAKASGALDLGLSSRKIADMAAERPSFVAALAPMATRGMLPAAGGILLVDDSGAVCGAVGVTGDTSDNDEACAFAGAQAAGLAAA
jgi:uncharacterized protein GlcG (DUF336 family)